MITKEEIIHYYDYHQKFYEKLWSKSSLAIHYGFWDSGVRGHTEALTNMNRVVADKARIKPSDIVLDAGCGIGGSSIWLAKNFGINVVGISISKKQVNLAKNLAKQNCVSHLTKFQVMDFLDTNFDDESFDVVWSIESVCHANEKRDFLNESRRILKRNGRLVISDGFLKKRNLNEQESKIVDRFCKGLALPNLISIEKFREILNELNFRKVKFFDVTKNIMPSSIRLYKGCTMALPFVKMLENIKVTSKMLTDNVIAGINQYYMVKKGIAAYGIFYAEK